MPVTIEAGKVTSLTVSLTSAPIGPEPGLLAGIVTDTETRGPIEGINLRLDSLIYTTKADGSFRFLELDARIYQLVAIDPLERYGGAKTYITINAGEMTTVNIVLTLVLVGLVGDLDNDGVITEHDLTLLVAAVMFWGTIHFDNLAAKYGLSSEEFFRRADINSDGVINALDIMALEIILTQL